MNKKFMAMFLFCGILTFSVTTSAEIKIFEGVSEHYIEDVNETLDEAKEKAKILAELDALEQAQVHIQSYSDMHNSNLTRDEIITITVGVLNVTDVQYKLSEESDGIMLMKVVLTAEIDTDKIPELVEREIKRREAKRL